MSNRTNLLQDVQVLRAQNAVLLEALRVILDRYHLPEARAAIAQAKEEIA